MDAVVQDLINQAKKNTDVEASAIIVLNGFANRIAAAVAAASSLSDADRITITSEINAMQDSATAAAAAVVANTPATA